MTDDINDVSHTSTLAKFEEAVRRSSPEGEAAEARGPVAWRWKVAPTQINWQYSDAPPAKFPVYNLELLYPDPAQECPLCPGFSTPCGNLNCPQLNVHAQRSPIPRAKGKEADGGWKLDFDWVDKLGREVEKSTGYFVTHECTEEIILRTEALLLSSTDRRLPREMIDREPDHGQYATAASSPDRGTP